MSQDNNIQLLEILEEVRQNATALAEILFSVGELLSDGSEISGDTITVLGRLAKEVKNDVDKARESLV